MSDQPEVAPEPSPPGSVVLDIGGDIGAAVVYTPEGLAGQEIEVRQTGTSWTGRHVAVHPRLLDEGTVWAAVFPELLQGAWEVRVKGQETSSVVAFDVTGGRVTTATFPAEDRHR